MLNEIDLSRADLNLLTLFDVVLKERHVGRAAKRLNLTASAISHGLGRLRRLLNDPLFLRTPKGVVPTARALELAEPVAEILAQVRRVVATAAPFDPKTSTRRFTLTSPDGVSAVFVPPLLAALRKEAPGIDLSIRQLLPPRETRLFNNAWESVLTELDARTSDIAIAPIVDIPARFIARRLYEEEFVVAMRSGHPFARNPTLDRFCAAHHVVVSLAGDPFGFVDDALARLGRTRRVALTVPNFGFAMSLIATTDLLAALPRSFVVTRAADFGVVSVPLPLKTMRYDMQAVAPKAALMDAGLAWMFELVAHHGSARAKKRKR